MGARPSPGQPRLRDVVIAVALLFVTWQCCQQAKRYAPPFQMSDVYVLSGEIAGYTTVDSPAHAASPTITTEVLRPRSAFWLRGQPDNLHFYLPGPPWQMANDVLKGGAVRLELTGDPVTEVARARQYPDTTFAQPLVRLAVGNDIVRAARANVARTEAAQQRWCWATGLAGTAALGWIGWAGWR